ncbi:phospholipid phosphatase 3-like isoform X3 [Varroa destructor]|uniref:Phosphatidic acid phosphatase type 2/haloperoxidase domain-containing protein n=1 Tax=Varroa destructor TaxID=109461 RepID=A0A7M7J9A5_VARDE|nr:phospholipid phosphatase 3-like isoform X3 [Varroa destructor]
MAVPRIENAVALHIILVAAVGLGLFVSRRMIDPARLLVPCNDNSISLPLKQETVTTAHIIAYICLIPPLIILITEFLRWHLDDEEWLPVKQMTLFSLWVPKLVQSLYICIGNFLYGAALTMMTVELGKKIAGRLRPHFIDACKPTNLVQFCEASRTQQYTVDLICSNKRGEINARESFPSAHAAASFYIAVYLLTYLQLRMSWKSVIVPVMRPMMQFAFIQVAFVIALTRVRDHYHFYSDVAAGAILGILCAFITLIHATQRVLCCVTHCENRGVLLLLNSVLFGTARKPTDIRLPKAAKEVNVPVPHSLITKGLQLEQTSPPSKSSQKIEKSRFLE